MSEDKVNVPKIRFPGFTGPWEQRKAKDLFTPIVEKGHEKLPVLSVTQEFGVVYRDEVGIDIKYDPSTLKDYKVIHPGDFVISLRSFQGGFELSDKLGITSPAYTIFKPKETKAHDNLFWKTLFKTFKFIESLKTVTFGIRDGKSISFSEFGDLTLHFPSNKDEQAKIGECFRNLDNLITLHQRKLNNVKNMKAGLLKKMFPKDGEDFPEVRFPGFTDAWEQRKLDTILKERKVKQKISNEAPLLAFAAGQGVIDRSERKTNNRDFLTKDPTEKTYLLTKYDDIVYNPSNLKYGAIDRNKHGQGVISPIYVTFETDEIPSFIELILKSENFKQRALQFEEGTVTKRQSVKPENLLSLGVVLPSSKDEQKKIGDFFKQLDDTITLHQRKLEHLQQKKKSLLQQMFV